MSAPRANLPENLELFRFGGRTFDYARDYARLSAQLRVLLDVLLADPLRWWTKPDLAKRVGCPDHSISARLSDCRKLGFPVPRRYIRDGLWEYRLEEEKTCG